MDDALVVLSASLFAIVGGLAVAGLVLAMRAVLRHRRKARAIARLAAELRPNQGREPPGRKVTVDELIARAKAEGRPVRLNWADPSEELRDQDWPTAVLPRPEIDRRQN